MDKVLCGVAAHVQVTRAAQRSGIQSKRCLERELGEIGATICKLSDCSHVILQLAHDPTEQQRLADEEAARQLAQKIEKVRPNLAVFSQLCILASPMFQLFQAAQHRHSMNDQDL